MAETSGGLSSNQCEGCREVIPPRRLKFLKSQPGKKRLCVQCQAAAESTERPDRRPTDRSGVVAVSRDELSVVKAPAPALD